jgi:hypothetical protein
VFVRTAVFALSAEISKRIILLVRLAFSFRYGRSELGPANIDHPSDQGPRRAKRILTARKLLALQQSSTYASLDRRACHIPSRGRPIKRTRIGGGSFSGTESWRLRQHKELGGNSGSFSPRQHCGDGSRDYRSLASITRTHAGAVRAICDCC